MIRINAIFPEEVLRRLAGVAKNERRSRTDIIRTAVADYLARYEARCAEKARARGIRHAMEIQDKLRKKAGDWPGTQEIRRWREAA